MRSRLFLLTVFTALLLASCSITPDRRVTRQELYRSNIFNAFTIKDTPESILATLNRDGEVVVEGKTRYGDEYFVKLLATPKGLRIRVYAK